MTSTKIRQNFSCFSDFPCKNDDKKNTPASLRGHPGRI